VVLAVWAALVRHRVGYEEQVLAQAFPEYAAYRERVGAFGPRLFRFARA
jgi:protein-S-isoprenylcysteine O-methyltransferase Ste14